MTRQKQASVLFGRQPCRWSIMAMVWLHLRPWRAVSDATYLKYRATSLTTIDGVAPICCSAVCTHWHPTIFNSHKKNTFNSRVLFSASIFVVRVNRYEIRHP